MDNTARWTFHPADPEAFARSEPRVFLIGMEPNGENYPPDQPKDMGHYFRAGLHTRGYDNLKFLRASLLQLEGVLRPLADAPSPPIWWGNLALAKPLLAHLLYLDLKPTEGGGRSGASSANKRRRVRRYVEANPKKIVSYWMRWKPSSVVLQRQRCPGCIREPDSPEIKGMRNRRSASRDAAPFGKRVSRSRRTDDAGELAPAQRAPFGCGDQEVGEDCRPRRMVRGLRAFQGWRNVGKAHRDWISAFEIRLRLGAHGRCTGR